MHEVNSRDTTLRFRNLIERPLRPQPGRLQHQNAPAGGGGEWLVAHAGIDTWPAARGGGQGATGLAHLGQDLGGARRHPSLGGNRRRPVRVPAGTHQGLAAV
jgi:hypothetical protein